MNRTRKFRKHLVALRKAGKISEEKYEKMRREIKSFAFKDSSHFKERIAQ